MNVRLALVAVAVLLSGLPAAAADGPTRLTDKQLKMLIVETNAAVDRFVDRMSPQMRTAVLRTPGREFDVRMYLQDLESLGKEALATFKPQKNSATAEVTSYLKTLKAFESVFTIRPGILAVEPYWDEAKPTFKRLAAAYEIDWNTDPADWKGRRLTDSEAAATK